MKNKLGKVWRERVTFVLFEKEGKKANRNVIHFTLIIFPFYLKNYLNRDQIYVNVNNFKCNLQYMNDDLRFRENKIFES